MTPSQAARALPPTTAPARRPIGPRRVSGPARPAPVERPLRRLVDHRLLDRLIRGRTWIGIVAFALIGIVTMQVALLKLNAGIGRSVARATLLQHENSLLAAQVSTLQADDLQRAETAAQGMVYAPPGDVRYLTAGKGDAVAAAATMIAPGSGAPSASQTATGAGPTSGTAAGTGGGQTTPTTSSTPTTNSGAATNSSATTNSRATANSTPTTNSSAPTPTQPAGATSSTSGTQGAAVSPSTPAAGQSSGVVGGAVAGAGG